MCNSNGYLPFNQAPLIQIKTKTPKSAQALQARIVRRTVIKDTAEIGPKKQKHTEKRSAVYLQKRSRSCSNTVDRSSQEQE